MAAVLLGGGAGLAFLHLGLSADASMLATFVGALLPVLWFAKQG